ncbi:band 4.1-like protein 2 isoform X2 [Hypomesus transpacificus]|uniref:band 4.1-like protein 2 isoform X2 n=1 Tax=Hypomesus transpacificus TaxID=137520 RepID=UPI001F0778F0|nr:band 4.1-like protein 2 isoform X2 [Hypomesus transpacificus]
MTTEVGSETEVKKEPEKEKGEEPTPSADAQSTNSPAPEQENQEVAAPSENTTPEAPEATTPEKKKEEEKEKEGPVKEKGISRFLPPWLKKQKSQTQVTPKEATPLETTPTDGVVATVEGEEEKAEPEQEVGETCPPVEPPVENQEVNGVEAEEKEEVKSEEGEKEESHSTGSADTQPAKEEKEECVEKGAEEGKPPEEGEQEKEEEEKEEKKEEDKSCKPEGHSILKSPLKLTKKMKVAMCHVMMLDGTQFPCEVEKRAKGQFLFFKVCEHLNLLEKDYFGLSYRDNADQKCWLDPTKEIKRQIRNNNWQFSFNVKFYPPDPSQLTEDITRYLLCLQLREDISSGRLPCSFVTHALLGSYSLQAELGDHDSDESRPLDYISDFTFGSAQGKEMEEKVVELHKTHRGMTPAQADAQFLENAKKLSMYGVDLHHAKDSEGVDIMLGVCSSGLLIYKDRLRINRFAWPKILKISYKRNNFYIKIRPGEMEQFESTVGFKLPNHRAAKRVWKVCVEHHTFFRLTAPEQPPKAKFLTLGSKFRYSGRTQAQSRQASSLIDRPGPYFQRTSSKRISRSLDGAPVINVTDADSGPTFSSTPGENGHDPTLELNSESKVEEAEPGAAATPTGTSETGQTNSALLQDLDKTQDEVLKHQASISELKRSFMEATPEPRPSQWEKRLTASPATSLRLQGPGKTPPRTDLTLPDLKDVSKQAEVEVEETVVIQEVRKTPKLPCPTPELVVTAAVETEQPPEEVQPEVNQEAIQEVEPEVNQKVNEEANPEVKQETRRASMSSESESEDEAEYHPQVTVNTSVTQIKEEPEEEEREEKEDQEELKQEKQEEDQAELKQEEQKEEEEKKEENEVEPEASELPKSQPPIVETDQSPAVVLASEAVPVAEEEGSTDDPMMTLEEAPNGHAHPQDPAHSEGLPGLVELEEEEVEPRVNGETERHQPQVICCSEPPVVKTEMVTISDTFAAQKTEIATKEVPIVHTETKTITYEAAQLDGGADGEPGVLMTAQTITSESLCTTTTTHITKTLKGGLSETRIEKRIVITGDSDIDHDQALAQAIKEAKEQHPDMSVTRVVVHKETELAEEGEGGEN